MTQLFKDAPNVQIINEKPPEWIMDGCMSAFRVDVNSTVWTYGDSIYNPGGKTLPDHVIAHETTHIRQQRDIEGGKDAWWKQFLTDPVFRIEQEAQAYGVQYGFNCLTVKDRNKRAQFLNHLASTLSGPLYQGAISHAEAMKLIKQYAPNFAK